LEHNIVYEILNVSNRDGVFKSLPDFMECVPISLDQLRPLVVFNYFDDSRSEGYRVGWEVLAVAAWMIT
jgi:hypothetical protein